MTAERARVWLRVAASIWAASVACSVLATFFHAGIENVSWVAALGSIAVACAIVAAVSWLTSMIAGPVVLIKLRGRPDTLGTWKSIVLPLSIAFGCICATAVPMRIPVGNEHCIDTLAAVPLVSAPFYATGAIEGTGFPAYVVNELSCASPA